MAGVLAALVLELLFLPLEFRRFLEGVLVLVLLLEFRSFLEGVLVIRFLLAVLRGRNVLRGRSHQVC